MILTAKAKQRKLKQGQEYEFKEIIPLNSDLKVRPIERNAVGFRLISETNSSTLYEFTAPSPDEKKQWTTAVQRVINQAALLALCDTVEEVTSFQRMK